MRKTWIFANSLLIVSYMQGALQKELWIAPFIERFKRTTFESLSDKFCQYFEQNAEAFYFCQFFADKRLSSRNSTKRLLPFVGPFKTTTLQKSH